MSVNEGVRSEELAAELAKAKREIETLKREKRRVGLSFHRIPETGHDIARLWNGDFPYLQKMHDNCLEKPSTDKSFSADANTVLIEADNLAALMAMQLTHKGQVDVIYIDPPYNTGNNDFIYNDARKSSISDVAGASADDYEKNLDGKARMIGKDDPERHSLWLSFMERRLWLAKELLSDKGVIFISIDDNEQARLKVLMDSIFGESNFEANIKWRRRANQPNDKNKMIASVSEYVLVYSKSRNSQQHGITFRGLPISNKQLSSYSNPDNDIRGAWMTKPLAAARGQGGSEYEIVLPSGRIVKAVWLSKKETYESLLKDNKIVFATLGSKPRIKVFLSEREYGQAATDWWDTSFGTNPEASKQLRYLLGELAFDYPKPVEFIKNMIGLTISRNATILDFFAGSGTTAHAVAELNKEDGGNRQCILVTHGDENGKNIAEDVTAERVKRVLSGKDWADGKEHEPLIGSLYYYKLLFAPKTSNPLTAMETMQTRFTGLASMEQDAHVQLEQTQNYTVLMNSSKTVIVWNNEDALIDEPESEFYPLLERLKSEYPGMSHIVYTPSTLETSDDEYGVEPYGWINYSYPIEYLKDHASLLERMKRNKTMLQPFASDDEIAEMEEANDNESNIVETSDADETTSKNELNEEGSH
jgi:adenine-specific DNA-methyltransferase